MVPIAAGLRTFRRCEPELKNLRAILGRSRKILKDSARIDRGADAAEQDKRRTMNGMERDQEHGANRDREMEQPASAHVAMIGFVAGMMSSVLLVLVGGRMWGTRC